MPHRSGRSWLLSLAALGLLVAGGCAAVPEDAVTAEEEDNPGPESPDLGKADAPFVATYTFSDGMTHYEQDDAQWGSELLFNGHHCRETIGAKGCAVTAHAILLSYYGGTRNPLEQSECLDDGGHSQCDIIWTKCVTPELSFTSAGGTAMST